MRKDLRTLCTNYHKPAFTLAEVLITLGIIGVVAAMTLPVLIQNHQKQTYVTGLKKGMSVVSNMLRKMVADEGVSELSMTELFTNGVCNYTDSCEDMYGNPSVIANIIPKYLNVIKSCKGSECNIEYITDKYVFDMDNNKVTINSNISKSKMPLRYSSTTVNGFYTSDGMIYYFIPCITEQKDLFVFIDTNGEKGPNEIGRDTFHLRYDLNGKMPESPYFYDESVFYLMQNGYKMDY